MEKELGAPQLALGGHSLNLVLHLRFEADALSLVRSLVRLPVVVSAVVVIHQHLRRPNTLGGKEGRRERGNSCVL